MLKTAISQKFLIQQKHITRTLFENNAKNNFFQKSVNIVFGPKEEWAATINIMDNFYKSLNINVPLDNLYSEAISQGFIIPNKIKIFFV